MLCHNINLYSKYHCVLHACESGWGNGLSVRGQYLEGYFFFTSKWSLSKPLSLLQSHVVKSQNFCWIHNQVLIKSGTVAVITIDEIDDLGLAYLGTEETGTSGDVLVLCYYEEIKYFSDKHNDAWLCKSKFPH